MLGVDISSANGKNGTHFSCIFVMLFVNSNVNLGIVGDVILHKALSITHQNRVTVN